VVNNIFDRARQIFKEVKNILESGDYKKNVFEFQKAIQKLISEYDTANWENRFVVGGALELLFCALLNSIGFMCKWLKEARYDIEVNSVRFSMKSNFTGSGDIRLINVLGDETVTWEEPTLFFISNIGICYADPEMEIKTKHTHDALVINVREIKEMIARSDDWLIPIEIPKKPKNSETVKTASYDVAKSILGEIKSQCLIYHFPEM